MLRKFRMGRSTGLEPATLGTTNRCSNQLSYDRHECVPKDHRIGCLGRAGHLRGTVVERKERSPIMNETIKKFGYPATLIKEFEHWLILLRPAQPTLGSLVLAAKSDATAYSELPRAAFAEQADAVAAIERSLGNFCAYERINYLMLMMVDPHVHFHVIPRYSGPREWNGIEFA